MLRTGGAERATCGHKQPLTLSTNPLLTYPTCCCSPLLSIPGLLQSLGWGTGFLTPQRDADCVAANWVPWSLGELVLEQSPKYSTWTRESGKVAPASQVSWSEPDHESEEKQFWRSGVKLQPCGVNVSWLHRGVYSKMLSFASLSGPLLVTRTPSSG